MKKLILLAVILAGVGIYRGWFSITSDPTSTGSSQEKFELSINKDKLKADAAAFKEKAADFAEKASSSNTPK